MGDFNPAPGSPFPTGSQPSSVAVADFNGDGMPDLAVANQADGTVSVLLGNGSGGFSPMSGSPFSVGAGSSPAAIVAGDFNGDGRADLAVVNSSNNNLSVLLGVLSPTLSITSSHSGPFFLGETGETYTITVTNSGPGITSGAVTVTDTLPAGMVATAIGGTGWNCALASLSCTSSATMAVGAISTIAVTVNVTAMNTGVVINQAAVSGGGAVAASGNDPTTLGVAITVQTVPAGLQFSMDGAAAQIAPLTLALATGNHTIAVQSPQAGLPGTQYVFTAWSDGGSASHSVTVGAISATYTATFKTQYQLTTVLNPMPGGSVTPPSGSYFDAGSAVTLTTTANSPYVFTSWSGGASGTSNPTQIAMSTPTSVTATFNVPGFTCAITGDNTASVWDVQQVVNEALGLMPANDDLTRDHVVDVADIQKLVDAVLGLGCLY
jgi:uncharacterized repeat protein (TIGR01451 family)